LKHVQFPLTSATSIPPSLLTEVTQDCHITHPYQPASERHSWLLTALSH